MNVLDFVDCRDLVTITADYRLAASVSFYSSCRNRNYRAREQRCRPRRLSEAEGCWARGRQSTWTVCTVVDSSLCPVTICRQVRAPVRRTFLIKDVGRRVCHPTETLVSLKLVDPP